MNVLYAMTKDEKIISHCRPDQDYSNMERELACIDKVCQEGNMVLQSYALADRNELKKHHNSGQEMHDRVYVGKKSSVPPGGIVVPPEGVTVESIDGDTSVVYVVYE